jgi:hypothetical protein
LVWGMLKMLNRDVSITATKRIAKTLLPIKLPLKLDCKGLCG